MSRSTPEWIGKNDNEAIPPRVKVRVFFRYEGRCAKCTRKLSKKDTPQYDHIVALCNGGAHRESNLQLLCGWHHRQKTAEDVAEKSMIYRKQRAHIGLQKSKHPMPCGKDSRFKKTFYNGTVLR